MAEPEEEYSAEQLKAKWEAENQELAQLTAWFRTTWKGDNWWAFHFATDVIDRQLDVSHGIAGRTLRELCAKGDVRSIRYNCDYDHATGDNRIIDELESERWEAVPPEEPEFIRPSEWHGKELDLDTKFPQEVAVSEDDLAYWIEKQPNKRQQARQRLTRAECFALADWGSLYLQLLENEQDPPTQEQDPPIKERVSRKQRPVREAINALWQGRVPDTVTNGVLVYEVGNWLTDYCKRQNSPKPEISGDTILRAAGRK